MWLHAVILLSFYFITAGCNGDFNNITDAEVRISDNRTGCIDIQIRDDSIAEGPEQFFVALSVPFGTRGITIQPNSTATVTILDDGDGLCVSIGKH